MSATRLLILGALRFTQSAHGYSIRRELESWNAETWVNVAYWSICFALNTLDRDGLVAVSDTEREGNRPARTISSSRCCWRGSPMLPAFPLAVR